MIDAPAWPRLVALCRHRVAVGCYAGAIEVGADKAIAAIGILDGYNDHQRIALDLGHAWIAACS